MRIGIDNVSPGEATSRQAPGGMRAYLCSLLRELTALAPQHEYILFTPAWADPLLEAPPTSLTIVPLAHVPGGRAFRVLYQQSVLAAAITRARLDVFLSTATIAPLAASPPIVLVVQFLQFYAMPEAYGRVRTAYLRLMLPWSVRRARRAIIFTNWAKQELIRRTRVPADKVSVIPHGLDSDILRLANGDHSIEPDHPGLILTGGRPYVLYVSATYGYKNHLGLIRAFARAKLGTPLPHALLMVGSQVHVSFSDLRAEAERAGVSKDVIIAGWVEDAASLYLGADLAAIPTLYETFGFPVLEAMALGCPVVTSNRGSMAELAGDAAILVDPLDEAALAAAMTQVLTDGGLRQQLIARGRERVRHYTWRRTAAETLALLEGAARG